MANDRFVTGGTVSPKPATPIHLSVRSWFCRSAVIGDLLPLITRGSGFYDHVISWPVRSVAAGCWRTMRTLAARIPGRRGGQGRLAMAAAQPKGQ